MAIKTDYYVANKENTPHKKDQISNNRKESLVFRALYPKDQTTAPAGKGKEEVNSIPAFNLKMTKEITAISGCETSQSTAEEANSTPKREVFVFKVEGGGLVSASAPNLKRAKEIMALFGYETTQSREEIILSEIEEALEDGMPLNEIIQSVRAENGEKNALLAKIRGYLESQLLQTQEASGRSTNREQKARLHSETSSLEESIQYVEDCLTQKDLERIKADPYVDTLLKVIDFKERHPAWHRQPYV